MIIIEKTLGNAVDPVWADRLRDAHVDLLHLDQWEAQKSRLRKTTESGVELALSLDRTTHLHDADILAWDAEKNVAIVARMTAGTPLAQQTATLNASRSPRPYLDLTYQLLSIGFALVPVALALYLLSANGRSAVRRIGRARLVALDHAAITSAQRYRRDGWWTRPLRNLSCLSLYLLGVSPRHLQRLYR